MRRVLLAVGACCVLVGPVVAQEGAPAAPSAPSILNRPAYVEKTKLPSHFFDSNGVKIHFVTAGQGEPVLLIHGFTANIAQNWRASGLFDTLAENYRVIALDNRGHGRSDKPHEKDKYGIEMVEDQVRLLDHLGIERAHIVGYSMGGFITNKLLSLHPERFMTATLGGAGWMRENDPQFAFMDELATSLEERKSIRPLIERLLPPDRPRPTDDQLKAIDGLFTLTNDTKALAAVARGLPALAVSEEKLKANTVPVLALIGDADPLMKGVDDLATVMPHLKVVKIAGADHAQAFGDPVFIKGLSEFLAAHPEGSAE